MNKRTQIEKKVITDRYGEVYTIYEYREYLEIQGFYFPSCTTFHSLKNLRKYLIVLKIDITKVQLINITKNEIMDKE